MNTADLTRSEWDAILHLADEEVIKCAADSRCVSPFTEKNQVKSVMDKWEVGTQIGLVKALFEKLYNVKFDIAEAKRMIATLCVTAFLFTQIENVSRVIISYMLALIMLLMIGSQDNMNNRNVRTNRQARVTRTCVRRNEIVA